jgi:hypothetical protein
MNEGKNNRRCKSGKSTAVNSQKTNEEVSPDPEASPHTMTGAEFLQKLTAALSTCGVTVRPVTSEDIPPFRGHIFVTPRPLPKKATTSEPG